MPRIAELNRDDRLTGPAIAEGLRARGFAAEVMAGDDAERRRHRYAFPALAEAAGRLLAAPDGPRIAAMEIGGWDTHAASGAADAAAAAAQRRAGGAEDGAGRRRGSRPRCWW